MLDLIAKLSTGAKTHTITALDIMGLIETLGTNDIQHTDCMFNNLQHNDTQHNDTHHITLLSCIVIMSVVKPSVIRLGVVRLRVMALWTGVIVYYVYWRS
jgi:hypothetical protein